MDTKHIWVKLEDVIKFLTEESGDLKIEHGLEKVDFIKPGHGNCCTCQTCGQYHDDCVCWHNDVIDIINGWEKKRMR